ncbi:stress-related protein-like isoform X2 [Rutidosis leptorrhynchoides]|uniref:stress-related protein-like isoform X2 n=1 Tax=Rutidosis leptorrhynchoides TaxID=125765 RepID=UPI003A98EAAD
MAESEANQTTDSLRDEGEKHLTYLEFVQSAVIYFVVCFSTVYDYAKENAGPLKPGVQTVENTVKTIIGPVYDRYQDVPLEILKFVDLKVGDALNELNRHVPELMKKIPNQAMYVVHNLPEVAKDLASEAFKTTQKMANTLYIKYEPTAKELYTNYEPVAEKYAVLTWRSLNKLPLFPQVAQIVVPTAAYFIDKYNYAVCYTTDKGYVVAQYLPLVPLDKIAKVFEEHENEPTAGQSIQVET